MSNEPEVAVQLLFVSITLKGEQAVLYYAPAITVLLAALGWLIAKLPWSMGRAYKFVVRAKRITSRSNTLSHAINIDERVSSEDFTSEATAAVSQRQTEPQRREISREQIERELPQLGSAGLAPNESFEDARGLPVNPARPASSRTA